MFFTLVSLHQNVDVTNNADIVWYRHGEYLMNNSKEDIHLI